jgi:CRISPR-associated endoribonuclease Cas6
MPFTLRSSTLTTTHLAFTVQTVTPLELNEYSGSALRGSFFNAIWQRFCTNKSAPTCAVCPLHDACPVSALVAPLREENAGGRDIPRPYAIVPPMEEGRYYSVGQHLSFGMILIGNIVQLLPYILLSIPQLEAEGLGHRLDENKGQRGRFRVERVECIHPFSGQRQTIYFQYPQTGRERTWTPAASHQEKYTHQILMGQVKMHYEAGSLRVEAPAISLQPQEYLVRANQLSKERITLQFLTPLRLIHQEHTVRQASFSPLIQRLLERYLALEYYYGNQELTLSKEEKNSWLHLADNIRCTNDGTHWQELKSYSNRQKRSTSIGGLIGTATFEGDLTPFLDLLIIGELIHVGKNVVKGGGWYKILA